MGVSKDSDSEGFIFLVELRTLTLLRVYGGVLSELRRHGVVRTRNADYSESLVAKALGLDLQPNSTAGFDALDAAKRRYEIKGRRLSSSNKSCRLSPLRNLDAGHFDYLW
jgi:hypothetical protein